MIAAGVALALAAAAQPGAEAATCAIGRVVLADIVAANRSGEWDLYVSPGHGSAPSLFERCPGLLATLPPPLHIADEAASTRAAHHGPSAAGRTAAIYAVGMPVFGRDHLTASVTVSYDCSGLCGGEYVQRYRRSGKAWRRDGGPRMKWVS